VQWLGEIGDASLVPALTALARGDAAGERVGSAAVFALGRLPDEAGVPTLTALVRTAPSERLQKDAVFWLGQQASRRAREAVRAAVLDGALPEAVRAQAVFALGHASVATADDFAFLQRLFSETRSGALREQVLMAVAQRGGAAGARWALGRARDAALPRMIHSATTTLTTQPAPIITARGSSPGLPSASTNHGRCVSTCVPAPSPMA
jgi:HEAT repeat protein